MVVVKQNGGGEYVLAISLVTRVRLHQRHELAMAVLALPNQGASARLVDLAKIIAPMLVETELSSLSQVSGPSSILVLVAGHGHIPSGLHQRLVVLAMLPDLLLAELDTSNA
jgi:hypothetical protein